MVAEALVFHNARTGGQCCWSFHPQRRRSTCEAGSHFCRVICLQVGAANNIYSTSSSMSGRCAQCALLTSTQVTRHETAYQRSCRNRWNFMRMLPAHGARRFCANVVAGAKRKSAWRQAFRRFLGIRRIHAHRQVGPFGVHQAVSLHIRLWFWDGSPFADTLRLLTVNQLFVMVLSRVLWGMVIGDLTSKDGIACSLEHLKTVTVDR